MGYRKTGLTIFLIIFSVYIPFFFPCLPGVVFAGELYSEKELWASGEMWIETQVQWKAESLAHQKQLDSIKKMSIPEVRKNALYKTEFSRHRERSQILAAKRDQVQNVLINETNTRVKGGQKAASGELVDTAGTKFGETGHRGMAGDRDMGGGERTVKKLKEVLGEMGIYDPASVKETAGTIEIGDDFELTINKSGASPRAGSEFHRIKAEVDARNPETYVSESMKTRGPDGAPSQKQAGSDYVEIQDHRKKAAEGLASDGDTLVKSPDKLQKMSKGTIKTLEMGQLDDDTVNRILKQNGINENPKAFRQRLAAMKEGSLHLTDPAAAERLRRASEDIFNAAERNSFKQAKQEIVTLREKAATLDPKDPKRMAIEDEIVDSVTKMKATRVANDELISGRTAPELKAKTSIGTADAPTKRTTPDAELAALDDLPSASARTKAIKTFSALMNIVDIGQSCQTLEDYIEGKVTLKDATLKIVDQYVTGGMIGTVEHTADSYEDYNAAQSSIEKANRTNMAAYLSAWELQLRKSGLSTTEARGYVASAMLAGNLEKLEEKAQALAADGKPIKVPKLVVDTFESDDTLLDRAKNAGEGFLQGIGDGMSYIVTAPKRTVEAWSEGELKEADLDAYAKKQEAGSKPALFRKLLNAGINSRQALEALNQWEDGKSGPLKELFRKARVNQEIATPTSEETAALAAENQRLIAEADRQVKLLSRYAAWVSYLRFVPLKLQADPVQVEIPQEGERSLVRLSFNSPDEAKFNQACQQLEKSIEALTGIPGKVRRVYRFSCKGKAGTKPKEWLTASPATAGIYPVKVTLSVEISGAGLVGPFAPLARKFDRGGSTLVEVTVAPEKESLAGETWDILRQTSVLNIDRPLQSIKVKVTPGAIIKFPVDYMLNGYHVKGEGSLKLTTDGNGIKEISIKTGSTYLETGKLMQQEEYSIGPFTLYSAESATATRAAHVYYTIPNDHPGPLGSFRYRLVDDSNSKWVTEEEIKPSSPNAKVRVHFYMTDEEVAAKGAEQKRLSQAVKAENEAIKQAAGEGSSWSGPFGIQEKLDGKILLQISLKKKVVAGTFRGERIMNKSKKQIITGEFSGTINPENGKIVATVNKSRISSLRLEEGKWYPATLAPGSMSKKTQLIGTLEKNTVAGYLQLDGKQGFAWTAVLDRKEDK